MMSKETDGQRQSSEVMDGQPNLDRGCDEHLPKPLLRDQRVRNDRNCDASPKESRSPRRSSNETGGKESIEENIRVDQERNVKIKNLSSNYRS